MVKVIVCSEKLNKLKYECSDQFEVNYLEENFEDLVKQFVSHGAPTNPQDFQRACSDYINSVLDHARVVANLVSLPYSMKVIPS